MGGDKIINVGLIGFGVVGSGVVELFSQNKNSGVNLKKIAVRDRKKARKLPFPDVTTNVNEILEDPDIDIIVELIGGYISAKDYIMKAIQNGKHVVTANKAVLAGYGDELFKIALENKVRMGFEASVCGGIPIIRTITSGLIANRFELLCDLPGQLKWVMHHKHPV